MNGANLHREILLACGNGPVRLFRINTGLAWTGDAVERLGNGDIVIRNARPLHSGMVKGGADLIGWRTVDVTPQMVGQRVALFAAIEAKSGRGRLTPEQQQFIHQVINAGGLAGEARSVADAAAILRTT
jgi:hypothetical protein